MNEQIKLCPNCGQIREIEEFNWRNKLFGIRQRVCKYCQSEYNKNHYQNNREQELKRSKKNKLQRIADAKAFIDNYLSEQYCADCGEYDPSVLTFDHVRGRKKNDISTMVANGYSIDKIMNEISKCEVVCSNCHLRREKKRQDKRRKRDLPDPNFEYNDFPDRPKWHRDSNKKTPLDLDWEARQRANDEILNRRK